MNESQQQQTYPDFPVSGEGLKRLHEAFGRTVHRAIEQAVQIESSTATQARVAETIAALKRQYEPAPADAEAEPTPIATAKAAKGG